MAELRHAGDHALAFRGGVPANVVDDEQVEVAVVIDVEPGGACGPAPVVIDTAFSGDVSEGAIRLIAVEGDAAQSADQQIDAPIAVEIPRGRCSVVACSA